MTWLSRREFGSVLVACLPVAAAARSLGFARSRLTIGVCTSSFRDLPRVPGRDNVDEVIRALEVVHATHIELALANVEPAPPSTAPFTGGTPAYPQRIVLTPEQIAAVNADARAALRTWRRRTPIGYFEDVRARLTRAGMRIHACAVAYDDSFTDDEIDATCRQVRALGAAIVRSPLTMTMATRLVPFANRHQISIAIHNQVDGGSSRAIATSELAQALALSPALTLALDVGNLTASNCDAVATLREHQSRVSHVLVKDRLRNGGPSQPFGEGDTPIADVLDVLDRSGSAIPALVEYDYIGLRSPMDEVTRSLAYMRR